MKVDGNSDFGTPGTVNAVVKKGTTTIGTYSSVGNSTISTVIDVSSSTINPATDTVSIVFMDSGSDAVNMDPYLNDIFIVVTYTLS